MTAGHYLVIQVLSSFCGKVCLYSQALARAMAVVSLLPWEQNAHWINRDRCCITETPCKSKMKQFGKELELAESWWICGCAEPLVRQWHGGAVGSRSLARGCSCSCYCCLVASGNLLCPAHHTTSMHKDVFLDCLQSQG